jgi:ComF family protein
VCIRCGDAVDAAQIATAPDGQAQCRTCRMATPPFVKAVSYGTYQGRLKDAIHALKYGGLYAASPRLGKLMAQAIGLLYGQAPSEMLVVPVPLHKSKHSQRGFNQARALASHALKSLAETHPQWRLTLAASSLVRLRATESQAGLTPRMRRMNVRGAFKVSNPAAVRDRHVLVVDDILTTGATARAVSKALIDAGAASVWVATLARARRVNEYGRTPMDEDDRNEFSGTLDAGSEQEASRFSSHDQRSF